MTVLIENIRIDNIDCSNHSEVIYELRYTYTVNYTIILGHHNKLSGTIVCKNPYVINLDKIKEDIIAQFKTK